MVSRVFLSTSRGSRFISSTIASAPFRMNISRACGFVRTPVKRALSPIPSDGEVTTITDTILSPRYRLEDLLHGCPEFYAGACGGSPPSVFRRDPSSRLLEASLKARSSASSLSPRGPPVSTNLHLLQSMAQHHIISIVGGGVSFLMRCLGSPPAPHGATCLHLGGGTSSGVPPCPAPPLAHYRFLHAIIKG